MLNFGLKHCHSSAWHNKFPRKRIEYEDPKHLGMHQHLRLRNEWFEGRQGFLSIKEIRKFLEANLGKNVDIVFSEFIKRARRYKHDVSLRKRFFAQLDPYMRCPSGYELDNQNRIIRSKEKRCKRVSNREAESFNFTMYPYNIKQYLRDTELTFLGYFYLKTKHWDWLKAPVYACHKDWYTSVKEYGVGRKYTKMNSMVRIHLNIGKDIAMGVPSKGYSIKFIPTDNIIDIGGYKSREYKHTKIPYTIENSNSDYIFLTKDNVNWSTY